MLPLSVEHDSTVTPCGGPFLLLEVFLVWLQVYLVPEHHVSYVALLLSCLLNCAKIFLLFSLLYSCSISGEHIPEGIYTSNNKGRVVMELKVTFYAREKFG
jgi:hypothetical protein